MAFNPVSAQTQVLNVKRANNPNQPAVILQCRILNVYPEKLTVDIFIPETAAYYYDVPITFPVKGSDYGLQAMPAKNMAALVSINDISRKPTLIGAFASKVEESGEVPQVRELILPGEIVTQSVGGGFAKQDQAGSATLGSQDGNFIAVDGDGRVKQSALGYDRRQIGSAQVGGIYLPKLTDYDDYAQLFNDEILVVNREEIYSGIENKAAYTVNDLLTFETGWINETLKTTILSNVAETVSLIQGNETSGGFVGRLTSFIDSFRDLVVDNDYAAKIAEIENFVNSYLLSNKGVKLTIDKGNSISGGLEDVQNILQNSSFETSSENNPICLKMTLTDIATSTEKARITLDNEGNCYVKVKKMYVEAENIQLVETV